MDGTTVKLSGSNLLIYDDKTRVKMKENSPIATIIEEFSWKSDLKLYFAVFLTSFFLLFKTKSPIVLDYNVDQQYNNKCYE